MTMPILIIYELTERNMTWKVGTSAVACTEYMEIAAVEAVISNPSSFNEVP
jgi:hypothetical protein